MLFSNTSKKTLYAYIFCFVISIISTLVFQDGFGNSDHVEQLPLIFRSIDGSYLSNDFFVNEGEKSVAREYYSKLIAGLSGSIENVPIIMFIVLTVSNILISIITFSFAKKLFRGSNMSGVFAVTAVMSVYTFDFGWIGNIFFTSLIPSTIAMVLAFMAIYQLVVRNRLLFSVFVCSITSLIHPLVGFETGFLLIGTFVVSSLIKRQKPFFSKNDLLSISASAMLLLIFLLVFFKDQFTQPHIDKDFYINLIAHKRHPHHYLASTFDVKSYVYLVVFISMTFYTYYRYKRRMVSSFALSALILGTLVIISCIIGYLFIEVFPTRIFTIAQPYRLLFLLKWLGLVFVSGALATHLSSKLRYLYIVCLVTPVSGFFFILLRGIKERFNLVGGKSAIVDVVLIAAALLLGVTLGASLKNITYCLLYVILIQLFMIARVKYVYGIGIVVLVLVGITTAYYSSDRVADSISFRVNSISNNIHQAKYKIDGDGKIVSYVSGNTPIDAVFLAPPSWGAFRVEAQRALVVDTKAFPFSDLAMLEWYDRIKACYGEIVEVGDYNEASEKLKDDYKVINDSKLDKLKEKYNITHAILFNQTHTTKETLFSNKSYKVVLL